MLLFVMDRSARPATDIWLPSAVNRRTLLSGITLKRSCCAILQLMSVWLQPVSGRQLITMPVSTGRSAKASHNGSSGVGKEELMMYAEADVYAGCWGELVAPSGIYWIAGKECVCAAEDESC